MCGHGWRWGRAFFEGCLVRWNILERTLSKRGYWPIIFRSVLQSIIAFPVLDFVFYFILHELGKCKTFIRTPFWSMYKEQPLRDLFPNNRSVQAASKNTQPFHRSILLTHTMHPSRKSEFGINLALKCLKLSTRLVMVSKMCRREQS